MSLSYSNPSQLAVRQTIPLADTALSPFAYTVSPSSNGSIFVTAVANNAGASTITFPALASAVGCSWDVSVGTTVKAGASLVMTFPASTLSCFGTYNGGASVLGATTLKTSLTFIEGSIAGSFARITCDGSSYQVICNVPSATTPTLT